MSDTKKHVKLTCEERLLLVSILTNARQRDAEDARRVDRIRKTLRVGAPDPRIGRETFELLDAGERARVRFEVVEIKDAKGEVVARAPKLDASKDAPVEFRLMPKDYAHVVDLLDNLPEGMGQPSGYQWLGLLDAFSVGELEEDTDPTVPDLVFEIDADGARASEPAGSPASEPAQEVTD